MPDSVTVEVRITHRPWWKVLPRLPGLWRGHFRLLRKNDVPVAAAAYCALRLCGVGLQIGNREVWP
jgi:hypothetical protein